MPYRWREVETLSFIEKYKSFPCLWDTSNDHYKNRHARVSAIKKMIQELNMPGLTVFEVKNKIKNLRSTYHQVLKKVNTTRKDSSGASYVPRLVWFEEFKEIMDKSDRESVKKESSYSNMSENSDNENIQDSSSDYIDSPLTQSPEQDSYESKPSIHFEEVSFSPPKKKRNIDNLEKVDKLLEKLEKYEQSPSGLHDLDEFQLFAMSIAGQLKKLPLESALRLQVEIHNLVANERIKVSCNNHKS